MSSEAKKSVVSISQTGLTASRNGFPVLQVEVNYPEVKGDIYKAYNQEIYDFLREHHLENYVNVIVTRAAGLDSVTLPHLNEIGRALLSESGAYIKEHVRVYVMAGVTVDSIVKLVAQVAAHISNVNIQVVDTEQEAWDYLNQEFTPKK